MQADKMRRFEKVVSELRDIMDADEYGSITISFENGKFLRFERKRTELIKVDKPASR